MLFFVKGYHTCRHRGTAEEIKEQVPFLSRPNDQWLGQGYYFWTDSPYWAERWLNEPKVISEFDITTKKENILDLVGNIEDQLHFKSLCEAFVEFCKTKEISVGAIIDWFRDEIQRTGDDTLFHFWGIRSKDRRSEERIPYLQGRREELSLVERHQICIYPEHKEAALKFIRFIHPDSFVEAEVSQGA